MTIKTENWLGEYTSTIGTGDITLGGAIDGFAGFSNVGENVDVYYTIVDALDKETGIGTLTGGKLVRKDIHATLVDGAYVKNGSAINLSGNAQVYGTANAHFLDYVQAVANAEIVNTQAIAELKALQINGHALTASFNLTAADVGAHPDSWMPSTEALNVYQKDASDIRYLKTQDAEQVAGLVMRVGGAREQQLQQSIDGLESRIDEALRRSYAEAGYNLVDGSFEAGGTLVNANDVLLQERTGKAFTGPAGTVAAGTNPASGGYKIAGMSAHFSSFYAMVASTEAELPVGSVCSTGGTMWVRSAEQSALTSFTPISAICGDDFGIIAGKSITGQTVADFLTVAYTSGCRGYFKSVGEVTVTSNIELLSIDKNLVVDWSGIKLFGASDGVGIRLSSTEIPSSLLDDMVRGSTVVRVAGAVEGDLIYIEDNEKYETQWNFNSRELFIAERESGSGMKVDRPALFRHLIANNVKVNRYKPVRLIFNNFKMEHFNNRDNSSFVNIGSVSFGTSASWFRGFYMPVFSGDVETSGGSSYELISCYMPRVGNVVANRCQYPISPTAGTYDTVIDSITASFCRHAASPTTWFNKLEVKKCVGYNNFATMDSHAGFDAKWRNVFATEEYDMPNIRCIGGELTDIEIVASLGTTPAEDPQIGIVTFTGDDSMYRDWIATNVMLNYPNRVDDIFALPWQAGNVFYENVNCMGGSIRCVNTASKIKTATIVNANAYIRLVGDCGNLKTLINNRVVPDGSFYMYENAPNAKKTALWEVNCGDTSGASANKVLKVFDNYGTTRSQNFLIKVKSCSSYNNGGSVAYIEKTYLVNHKVGATSAASISSAVNETRINGSSDTEISLDVTLNGFAGYTQSADINAHFFELTIATATNRPNNVFSITVGISKLH